MATFRGEQAATALEANLNNLENKLDALLAAMDALDEGQSDPLKPAEADGGHVARSTGNKKASGDKDKSSSAAS